MTREILAFTLIAVIVTGGAIWIGMIAARRKRQKLRRKGIKTFGH